MLVVVRICVRVCIYNPLRTLICMLIYRSPSSTDRNWRWICVKKVGKREKLMFELLSKSCEPFSHHMHINRSAVWHLPSFSLSKLQQIVNSFTRHAHTYRTIFACTMYIVHTFANPSVNIRVIATHTEKRTDLQPTKRKRRKKWKSHSEETNDNGRE